MWRSMRSGAAALAVLLAASSLPAASAGGIGLVRRSSAAARLRLQQPGDVQTLPDAEDILPVEDSKKAAENIGEAARVAASYDLTGSVRQVLDAAQGSYQEAMTGKLPEAPAPPTPPLGDLTNDTPEAVARLGNYMVAQGTVAPAPFNGVYCRGGACQYRVPPPPITATLPPLPPPGETCRGLGCPPMVADLTMLAFAQNCSHIFVGIGGGLPPDATIGDVRASFLSVCNTYLPLEQCKCNGYADVFVGALGPLARKPTVGSVNDACMNVFNFIGGMKTAEIDLGLLPGSAPESLLQVEGNTSQSELAAEVAEYVAGNPFDHEQAGPCSPRGQRWRKWVEGGNAQNLGLVQEGDIPRAYNPPCAFGFAKPRSSAMKYQIAPPCAAGLPPAEVDGASYAYCVKQFSEITLGAARGAQDIVHMTEQWCGWQTMVSGMSKDGDQGRPDWDQRTCKRMGEFVAFALRNDLETKNANGPQAVCKKMFISAGLVKRVGTLVETAYAGAFGGRGAPTGDVMPSADDPAVKAALKKATELAQAIFKMLKMQKEAMNAVQSAKDVVAGWEASQKEKEEAESADDSLPNADDLDMSLIATDTHELRRWGAGDAPERS